jgi:uracil-DNA glycosylase family 4
VRRAAYRDQHYWGRPVSGFGDADAWLWIIGLAPGAHGANRTGRVFTGDRSGDFLFAALHRAGLASSPISLSRDDNLQLRGCFISAAVRCAPPGNKPTRDEIAACSVHLDEELRILGNIRVILALGRIAWDCANALLARHAHDDRPVARAFSHGAFLITRRAAVVASYHVSQQNTFTRRLTPEMFDAVLARCRAFASDAPSPVPCTA